MFSDLYYYFALLPFDVSLCHLAALSIRFVNDTPILSVDSVYAEIEISRPGVAMECHLTHLSVPRMDCKCFYRLALYPSSYSVVLNCVDQWGRRRGGGRRGRSSLHCLEGEGIPQIHTFVSY